MVATPEHRIRITKPGAAEQTVHKSELADYIAAGWFPRWDQSVETVATQVAALRDAIVELVGEPVDPPVTVEQIAAMVDQRLDDRLGRQPPKR